MPTGYEIHLAFEGPEAIFAAMASLGLSATSYDNEPVTIEELRSQIFGQFVITPESAKTVNKILHEAYEAIAALLGWTLINTDENGHTTYNTPHGRRQTHPFQLCLQFDEDELEEEPEDATLGVNLSSRYFPSILDAKNEHGTLRGIGGLKSLSPQIEICYNEITKRLPIFEEADVVFREIFY